jgi:hypothetical protein
MAGADRGAEPQQGPMSKGSPQVLGRSGLEGEGHLCGSCGADWSDFDWERDWDREPPCICDLQAEGNPKAASGSAFGGRQPTSDVVAYLP